MRQLGAGPECGSFSEAVSPPCRTRQFPRGRPGLSAQMREKVRRGNDAADWLVGIIRRCIALRVWWWVENPRNSWLWRQRAWRRLKGYLQKQLGKEPGWVTDCCRWGRKWRKRTYFLMQGCLSGARTLCEGGHRHLILRGHFRGTHWTKVAEAYPMRLADYLARRNCADCGWVEPQRVEPATRRLLRRTALCTALALVPGGEALGDDPVESSCGMRLTSSHAAEG